MTRRSIAAWAAALFLFAAAAGLVACGGGVGSGGTGISAGIAQGTVNGFGSVVLDGLRFDDRNVAARSEDEPGREVATEVRLGHRVELGYDAGTANRLLVKATLAGPVAGVLAPGQFVVLGQTVLVNTDATAGPVTQFGGGYTGAAAVMAGDAIEVHGLIEMHAGVPVVQATRIERLAALPTYLKVSGIVAGLSGSPASTFLIGQLTVDVATAAVLPAGRGLANGQRVTVWALPSTLLNGAGGAPSLAAAQVRIEGLGARGDEATLSGTIGALDAVVARFDLGGVTVRYAGAVIAPAGTTLANGKYVRVRGRVQADGSLQADSVTLRDGSNEAEAELKGNISAYDATTQTFQVRDVAVDASGAEIESCPGGNLADGLYVEVHGRLGPTGVLATEVHCEDEPDGATIERKGVAGSVDATAATFVLTPTSGAAVTVQWTALTYFGGVTPQTLAGARVEVVGALVGGVLVAQKVKVED
jgi:hypothetical protein